MIPSSYYYPVYLTLLWLLITITVSTLKPDSLSFNTRQINSGNLWLSFIICLFISLFLGFRPDGPEMGDTMNYRSEFILYQLGTLPEHIISVREKTDIAWWTSLKFFASLGISSEFWLFIIDALNLLCILTGIHLIFKGKEFVPLLCYLAGFGVYSGLINGLRNGLAISIWFLGYSLYKKGNLKLELIAYIIMWISYQFHHSTIMLISSFIISRYIIKKTQNAIIIWILAIITSLLFGSSLANLIASLGIEERASSYLNNQNDNDLMSYFSHTGFRWDFLLYSAVPVIFGYYITCKLKISDLKYQLLLNTYILSNALWIIFIYAAFSNRYAALSWGIYPFVICYPLLKFPIRNKTKIICLFLIFEVLFLTIYLFSS